MVLTNTSNTNAQTQVNKSENENIYVYARKYGLKFEDIGKEYKLYSSPSFNSEINYSFKKMLFEKNVICQYLFHFLTLEYLIFLLL